MLNGNHNLHGYTLHIGHAHYGAHNMSLELGVLPWLCYQTGLGTMQAYYQNTSEVRLTCPKPGGLVHIYVLLGMLFIAHCSRNQSRCNLHACVVAGESCCLSLNCTVHTLACVHAQLLHLEGFKPLVSRAQVSLVVISFSVNCLVPNRG